jgi:hypothetical protein
MSGKELRSRGWLIVGHGKRLHIESNRLKTMCGRIGDYKVYIPERLVRAWRLDSGHSWYQMKIVCENCRYFECLRQERENDE